MTYPKGYTNDYATIWEQRMSKAIGLHLHWLTEACYQAALYSDRLTIQAQVKLGKLYMAASKGGK
ncbi:MAG: hypothetical protein XU15_C0011G0113 [candidate division NC10 bacterium CSP1-5]|nr:MAG: hypothetical protein XU15_C0011G0113 [candidate division NC10 bacterium CSP1-5]